MTSSIRVLTTSTLDSSPSVVLTSPDGSVILINCGEGCQRSFLESSSQYTSNLRIRSVDAVCLTHLGYDSIGGLPGFILTSADVAVVAAANVEMAPKKKRKFGCENTTGGFDLYGPLGTAAFIHSLRHFMKRDEFPIRIHEADTTSCSLKSSSSRHKDKINVTVISCFAEKDNRQSCSFIFKTPPIAGKFIVEKAERLGIPPGPLYAQLKAGQSVSFVNSNTQQTDFVRPHQVLEHGHDGISIAFLYVPDIFTFQKIKQHQKLQSYYCYLQSCSTTQDLFRVIIHHVPKSLFSSPTYLQWIRSFGPDVQHITLFPMENYQGGHEDMDVSPFRSAILGGMTRSFLCPQLFPNPIPKHAWNVMHENSSSPHCQDLHITMAHSMMEFILIPLAKSGFVFDLQAHGVHPCAISMLETEKIQSFVQSLGTYPYAEEGLESFDQEKTSGGKLIFLGTGSALPCKHRNVSGIYLEMDTGHAILLDVGEGSVGQLLRSSKSMASDIQHFSNYANYLLQSIQAVWISHPHADHHLGILHLLTARNASFSQTPHGQIQPLILMAPPCIFQFLTEYEKIDPSISLGYTPLHSSHMTHGVENPMGVDLNRRLGITSCMSVPVDHCLHSFALILDGTSFGRVVYSGDCRPSNRLSQVAKGTDLLIHEATFEDGMELEAALKRHTTVGEAIRVAEEMDAKFLFLTHFSQRYPKIPPLPDIDYSKNPQFPVAFAFDYMRVTPQTLITASKLLPSLRKLYEDDKTDVMVGEDDELLSKISLTEGGLSAKDVLDKPGTFIRMDCLTNLRMT